MNSVSRELFVKVTEKNKVLTFQGGLIHPVLFDAMHWINNSLYDIITICRINLIHRGIKMKDLEKALEKLAEKYSKTLKKQLDNRIEEMKEDDKSHYLIYRVLGISTSEGDLIDVYQNKGRFLYKYAGSFLEEATILCFEYKFANAKRKVKVENNIGVRPKKFEIDCLVNNLAYEIKWRDATTDGDHITKEHTRVKVIQSYGYTPVRIMFYYPNRDQAIKIQNTLKTLYAGVKGEYYSGDDAWDYVKEQTGVDLKNILERIADKKV